VSLRRTAGLLLTVGLAGSGGCWFEQRPEPRNGGGGAAEAAAPAPTPETGALRDSVRAVITAFHDALRVGDGGRVASLSVPGATVLDQEEGVAWHLGPEGGETLPGPLESGPNGLGWEPVSTDFVVWERTALVVDRYAATVEGEAVPWTAVETLVLERTPEGWRIRHVHRSRGGGTASRASLLLSEDGAS
jgi:hypothetical protein